MRSFITSVVAIVLAIGGIAFSLHDAEARTRKRVKQPAYSISTNCLPQQLKNYLKEVERRFGKVVVISSFRRNAIIAGTHHRSKHASCQAVDFVVKQNQRKAAKWLKTQNRLEVITYSPPFHHIHIATVEKGKRAYHGHKGGKKSYAKNRRRYKK